MVTRARESGVSQPKGVGLLKAIIYTRVSDPNEDNNGFSHEFQEKACRDKAKALGVEVVAHFKDNFSGRYLYERPGLGQLRELVRAGGVQVVLVWKLDRFSRNFPQRAVVAHELRQHGCRPVSATEEISDTPEGRLLEALLGAIAEFEVERTLERSQATLHLLRSKKQIICQGLARYGYRYDKATRSRVIVEEEAKWVRHIFDWYVGGMSAERIAMRLTGLKVPTPAVQRGVRRKKKEMSGEWCASTVRMILKEECYTGEPMVSGKKRSTGGVTKSGHAVAEKAPESEWWTADSPTPTIVSRGDFDLARQIMSGRRSAARTRNGTKPYLLRGMVECGVCGKSMSPTTVKNPLGKIYHYFSCISRQMMCACGNGNTNVDYIDEAVWGRVVAFMHDSGAVERRFRELAQENQVDQLESDLLVHDQAIATARGSVRRLVVKLEEEDDPEVIRPIEDRLAELKGVIAAHQSEAELLRSRLRVYANQEMAIRRAKEAIALGMSRLEAGASFEEKRDLLEALDVRVVAQKKDLVIRLGLPLEVDGEFVNDEFSPRIARRTYKHRLLFVFTVTGAVRALTTT